jgi:hypothetical protein
MWTYMYLLTLIYAVGLSVCLAVAAALLHVVGYILYNAQVFTSKSRPNPASWLIWVVLAGLNAFSFTGMTDWVSALQFFAGTVACLITFCIILFTGHLGWPKKMDMWSLVIGLVAVFVWWRFKTAAGANMIIAFGIAVSIIPTIQGVLRDRKVETPLAWWFWTVAPVLTGIVVIMRGGGLVALVMPALLVLCHGSVAVLAGRRLKGGAS